MRNKNIILKSIGALLTPILVLYLFVSFAVGDFNINHWDCSSRGAVSFIGFIIGASCLATYHHHH